MAVVIAMLRGVNVVGNNQLSMEGLRILCESLGLRDVETYIQSGNVLFREDSGDLDGVARKLGDGIERKFGFRPKVIVRTPGEMRKAIAKNPFGARAAIEPSRLLVVFMAAPPPRQLREQVLALPCSPEELLIQGREMYIDYPNGMARPKIPLLRIEKMLGTPCTGRNLNTVTKLASIATRLEELK